MITEIIVFDLPDGMTREEVVANYSRSAPKLRETGDRNLCADIAAAF